MATEPTAEPLDGEERDPVKRERAACAYLAETHTGMWDNATAEAIAAAIRERGETQDDFALVDRTAWAAVQPFWLLLRHGQKLPADLGERMEAAVADAPFAIPERLLGPEWGPGAFLYVLGERYTPRVWGKHEALHYTRLSEAYALACATDGRLADVIATLIWDREIVSNRAQLAFSVAAEARGASPPPEPTSDVEELARELRRLVSYGRWQIEEGGPYHPTLGSALASAEAALAARGLHTAAINARMREDLARKIEARNAEAQETDR